MGSLNEKCPPPHQKVGGGIYISRFCFQASKSDISMTLPAKMMMNTAPMNAMNILILSFPFGLL